MKKFIKDYPLLVFIVFWSVWGLVMYYGGLLHKDEFTDPAIYSGYEYPDPPCNPSDYSPC